MGQKVNGLREGITFLGIPSYILIVSGRYFIYIQEIYTSYEASSLGPSHKLTQSITDSKSTDLPYWNILA